MHISKEHSFDRHWWNFEHVSGIAVVGTVLNTHTARVLQLAKLCFTKPCPIHSNSLLIYFSMETKTYSSHLINKRNKGKEDPMSGSWRESGSIQTKQSYTGWPWSACTGLFCTMNPVLPMPWWLVSLSKAVISRISEILPHNLRMIERDSQWYTHRHWQTDTVPTKIDFHHDQSWSRNHS